MEQGKNSRKETRATFAEFVRSIKFSGKRKGGAKERSEQGFAVNRSRYSGVAPMDDYQHTVLSSN